MAIRYLYLDDETPDIVRPFISEVEDNTAGLKIDHHAPKAYGAQLTWLSDRPHDGIILDLRLDQRVNWEEPESGSVDYRAAALAQELRTRSAESGRNDVPIVLWSTDKRLNQTYRRDDFSHDLYDLTVRKDEIEHGGAEVGRKLIALARGYERIAEIKRELGYKVDPLYRFLGLKEQPSFLDARLLGRFVGRGSLPPHVLARFILKHVVEPEGPLIGRETLLARLGAEDKKGKAETAVIKLFDTAKYDGPFHEGWLRWWGSLVDDTWAKHFPDAGPLRRLSAPERVATLSLKLKGVKLTPAERLPDSQGDRYWTVCQATRRPLDPRDGFALAREEKDPWLADLLVSVHAVREGLLEKDNLVLSPLEEARAANLAKK